MHTSFRKFLAGLLLLAAFAAVPGAPSARSATLGDSLGFSPHWDWKTIESTNFRVTFPAEMEAIARKVTGYYEEAHVLLSSRLRWSPRHLTQVVLVDNTDLANGLTSPALRLGMILMVTPPDTTFSTQYYDDWLRLLVIHEYTHFLNMDPTRDWLEILRLVFGDAIRPNALWHVWMLEGLAVYMETRMTRAGRGRSSYYEMVLRAAVEEGTLDTSRFVTLDKLHGSNPWYPAGETPYLFGYELMNQIAKDPAISTRASTHDRNQKLTDGEEALGILSQRSSARIPFFVNGNLENVTGKDWYRYWNEWVAETRARMERQLKQIKSEPLTAARKLSDPAVSILGIAASPDGRWLAYTQDSSDERLGLYLRNLQTGETRRITEKMWGIGLAFTPDSKTLLFSSIQRSRRYYLVSDIAAYDVDRDSVYWLTSGARYKDPDVSRDGKQIVFATTQGSANSIAVADLVRDGRKYKLGPVRIVYPAKTYESAANPKFTPDGKGVVFSFHPAGQKGLDLLRADLESHKTETLVSDRRSNRFPAFGPSGDLYFVSDRSGVDNLYRIRAKARSGSPEQVTNVTTGVWLPAIASGKDGADLAYASVLSSHGWSLAEVQLASAGLPTAKLTVEPPPAPAPLEATAAETEEAQANSRGEVKDYSIFPSIWPRQWAPIVLATPDHALLGGQVLGFDALDEHEYLLFGAYDTLIRSPEGVFQYNNRSFGPVMSFYGEYQTSGYTISGGNLQRFERKIKGRTSLSYPIPWTYSSLTPEIGAQAEREFGYLLPNRAHPASYSRFVPSVDFTLTFGNTQRSRLALLPESGRRLHAGVRRYFDAPEAVHKGIFTWAEFLDLGNHAVAVPAVAGMWTSRSSTFADANANAKGRSTGLLQTDQTPTSRTLDELRIRGYPGRTLISRSIALGSFDLQIPIARIFRGWGTNPIFLRNLYAVGFAESAVFYSGVRREAISLPSAGGGLRLSTDILLNLPLVLSAEYHQGFRKDYGGKGEFFVSLLAQNPF